MRVYISLYKRTCMCTQISAHVFFYKFSLSRTTALHGEFGENFLFVEVDLLFGLLILCTVLETSMLKSKFI